jgi:hypothetical protein
VESLDRSVEVAPVEGLVAREDAVEKLAQRWSIGT